MVTGRRAFRRESPAETMSAILTEPPSTLVFRSDTPRSFEYIVQRCLEKNPADRFQSARELALALDSAIDLRSAGPPRGRLNSTRGPSRYCRLQT